MSIERTQKAGVFILCLLPFMWVVYAGAYGDLGPDPAKSVMLFSGEWALRLLALTLLVSPLRAWTGNPAWLRLRRMLGLFTFFYACVHFLVFLHMYTGWDTYALTAELGERPYITLGFIAWALMVPLAITSTQRMQRRLRANWRRLHRLVYPAAILACLHLLWQVRSDAGEALIYIVVFAVLLVWRFWRRLINRPQPAIFKQ